MLPDYKDLVLAGAFIKEILLVPGQTLTIKLLRGPARKNNRDVVEELLLEFGNLKVFQAQLTSDPTEPSIEILSHSIKPSDITKGQYSSVSEAFSVQFVLSCDKGDFTISAANFTWSVIDEIPFVSSSTRGESSITSARQGPPEPVKCSFCGRSAGEVMRIIKGNTGSICTDCLQTCVKLIATEQPTDE